MGDMFARLEAEPGIRTFRSTHFATRGSCAASHMAPKWPGNRRRVPRVPRCRLPEHPETARFAARGAPRRDRENHYRCKEIVHC